VKTINEPDEQEEDYDEEEEQYQTLSFKTEDIEPDLPDPVWVELGGEKYRARCPNTSEMLILKSAAAKMREDPQAIVDLNSMLHAMFDYDDSYEILARMLGENPELHFLSDIRPTVLGILEHYSPLLEKRNEGIHRRVSKRKKSGGSRKGGRKR
jgi:hypothetical protein